MRQIKVVIAVFTALLLCCVLTGSAQTTNAIPPNLFLTDDGQVFWYKPGQRLVSLRKIQEARRSSESRPAIEDPQGNWTEPTNGFQVSLRFSKTSYTVGEHLTAIVLIRNVTTNTQTYFRPLTINAQKNGQMLKRKNESPFHVITVPPTTSLFPQTQHRYQFDINKDYDLSESGEYTFQAECKQPEVTSKKVSVLITSAPASK